MLKIGALVNRQIDGLHFPASIQRIHENGESVDVKYIEDDTIEENVPLEDLRYLHVTLLCFHHIQYFCTRPCDETKDVHDCNNGPVHVRAIKDQSIATMKDSLLLQIHTLEVKKDVKIRIHHRGEIQQLGKCIMQL